MCYEGLLGTILDLCIYNEEEGWCDVHLHEWEAEYNLTLLNTIDTNESLPTGQLLALPYHTQREPTHEVMILVLQSGHS